MARTSEKDQQESPAAEDTAKLYADPEARAQESERVLAEQLKQQAEAPAGDVVPEAEQAVRAAHSAEGGGAWPVELLNRGVAPVAPLVGYAPEQVYTSHEQQDGEQG